MKQNHFILREVFEMKQPKYCKLLKHVLLHFSTVSLTKLQFLLENEDIEPEETKKFWDKIKQRYKKL